MDSALVISMRLSKAGMNVHSYISSAISISTDATVPCPNFALTYFEECFMLACA